MNQPPAEQFTDRLELPADRPRPARLTLPPAAEPFELPAAPVTRLAAELGTTTFAVLLAAVQIVLHRYSGQEHFVVGSPAAGGTIGLLRADVSGDPSVRDLVARAARVLARGAGPAEAPAGDGGPPPAQVLLEFGDDTELPAATIAARDHGATGPARAALDSCAEIALSVRRTGDRLVGVVGYRAEMFDKPTVSRLAGHLGTVLAAMAGDPGLRAWQAPVLTEQETRQLLVEWNGTTAGYPAGECVFQLVERQARRAPEAVALVCGTERISYRQLNMRANQVAHHLRAHGVGAGTLVAVLAERGTEMVVGLLGILKAGGAYVPLDPDYPAARLAFMLEDSAAPVVLTLDRLAARLPAGLVAEVSGAAPANTVAEVSGAAPASTAAVIRLDADWDVISARPVTDPEPLTTPADLAYVTYTSGSTGRPKGVMVEHRSVVSFVTASGVVRTGPDRVFFQFVPVSFDVSAFEIWTALAHGSRLVIAPPGRPGTAALAELIRDEGVTTLWLTAPLFHEMVAHHAATIGGVQELVAGGDVVSPVHFTAMLALPGSRSVINGYGPTEATVLACTFAVPSDGAHWRPADQGKDAARVPIGRPVGNLTAYVLDRHGNLVPAGTVGELCLGGAGIARGYLRRPALTAERFMPDPFGPAGSRLYRTGDLARHLPDGTIDFLGRADHQLKIRGFRVEAGEIEAALMAHPAVRECVVVGLGEDSAKRLVGYVVTAQDGAADDSLRQFVAERLPGYMLPSAFVVMDALPLTPNGKVDRSALPRPAAWHADTGQPRGEPSTDAERLLLPIARDVLEIKDMGVHDDIFDLGCDSLQVLRLLAIIGAATGVDVEVAELYEHPTVAKLGAWITKRVP